MVTTPLIMTVSNDNGRARVHCSRCGPTATTTSTTTNAAADQAMADHVAEHHKPEWREHLAARKR